MPVLQFKGKTAVENYHHTVPHHALEFDAKLSVLPKGESPNLEGNLIIEGDNLLALKALLPTHAGRIKCIYIDPPYNTGNEGWVYNDNLTQPQFKEWIGQTVGKEAEDACRHDKWCCMMYPRLQLLKELLRDDGAIFVSIDDNEVANLRLLMDEVFGESNFLAVVCWQKVFAPKPAAKKFSTSCEYVVGFAKNVEKWDRQLLPRTKEQDERYTNADNDPRGPWASDNLLRNEHRDNSVYTIVSPNTGKEWTPEPGTSWRHPESEMLELIENDEISFGEDGNNMPRRKKFLKDVQKGRVPETLWYYDEVGHTQDATRELTRILGSSRDFFPYPKPVDLIYRIVQITTRKDEIVLDSCAGSGTTGQAVLKLNRDDGGKRSFVLCQNRFDTLEHRKDKTNICESVTAQRLRNVIGGYSYSNQKKKRIQVDGLGGSFTYARLGPCLFGEYKVWEKELPGTEELAKYIFYTETSREFQPKEWQKKTGRIGEHKGTAFYLLYAPGDKNGRSLDTDWLASVGQAEKCKKLVVYCEKLWLHRQDREKWEHKTGKSLRVMQLPMGLK
ncbi:MAG: site-specific DNA-methyltransferase [Gemmataceae bacterium]|nr:site-specific DNA-methyltransferase [Gemmataceae bacterium]